MKSEGFFLADFVSITENKLTMVNTFDTIHSEQYPFVFRPFGIAYKLIAEKGDYGKEFDLTLVIKTGEEEIFTAPPIKARFTEAKHRVRPSHIGALNLVGVQFRKPGAYIVELRKGKNVVCHTELYVVKGGQRN